MTTALQRQKPGSAAGQASTAAAAGATNGAAFPATAAGSFLSLGSTSLEAELAATAASFLEPQAFFVSWQGVLTLAYSGFTTPLMGLKQRLTAAHPSLPPENPGSKWPKTSLGCLLDERRLTPEQLALLCRICGEESAAFQQHQRQAGTAGTAASAAAGSGAGRLAVDSACVALFESRSLERLVSCQRVAFQGGLDEEPPSSEEQARVAGILAEPSAPDYWFCASRDGNREAHYRGPHLGATLVHLLLSGSSEGGGDGSSVAGVARPALKGRPGAAEADAAARQGLLAAIARFRHRVDEELPGMYTFFADASLHITVRALIN